jgi:hypothetical protein
MDPAEMAYGGVDWIDMAQDRAPWRALLVQCSTIIRKSGVPAPLASFQGSSHEASNATTANG